MLFVPMEANVLKGALFSTEKNNYTLYGALFGLLFLVVATVFDARFRWGHVSPSMLATAQLADPLLWIIDTAPFFLGFFARIGGIRQDRLHEALDGRDDVIRRQTEDLREALAGAEEANRAKSTFLASMSHSFARR